jgi:hypothetical protein
MRTSQTKKDELYVAVMVVGESEDSLEIMAYGLLVGHADVAPC